MPRKLTREIFIERARAVHGNKYDYSKVVYTDTSKKVCVICPEHGEFWPTANNHLNGSGCPQCAGRTVSTEGFIKKARSIHGLFNYLVFMFSSYLKGSFTCRGFRAAPIPLPQNVVVVGFYCCIFR